MRQHQFEWLRAKWSDFYLRLPPNTRLLASLCTKPKEDRSGWRTRPAPNLLQSARLPTEDRTPHTRIVPMSSAASTRAREEIHVRRPNGPSRIAEGKPPTGCAPLPLRDRVRSLVEPLLWPVAGYPRALRSEEHTSELQSHSDLVCRLLL